MSMRTSNEQRQRRRELDDVLDEALKQTFPASDPFSIGQFTATEPPLRPVDRRAPRIEPHQAGARRRRRRRTA
jgi:hypothetical protein